MIRLRFELTKEQFNRIMDASLAVPYIVAGGMEPVSPQESANYVWQELGKEMGFIWNTVRPVDGEPQNVFSAKVDEK